MIEGLLQFVFNMSSAMQIIMFILLIVVGFFALIKGADGFVGGASSIAYKLKIPQIIVGLTIVSIGTSLPEASVSISAGLASSADIAVANVVGSNIVNILLVLGATLIFKKIMLTPKIIKTDLLFILLSACVILVFILTNLVDGVSAITRVAGIILFALFIAYLVFTIILELKLSKKQSNGKQLQENEKKIMPMWLSSILLVVGLAGIIVGGDFVVFGAKNLAINVGMSETLVGLTIVAIGTSLPELVTSIVAIKKKNNDIAFGNVVGSCIFNMLFILGLTSIITPLSVAHNVIIDFIIMTIIFLVLFLIALWKKSLPRILGWIFVLGYVAYLTYIITRDFIV